MAQSQVRGWHVQRTAREVLERQRVVLEGGVQVGLGQVPRVPRLGEERKVGEPEVAHQPRARFEAWRCVV